MKHAMKSKKRCENATHTLNSLNISIMGTPLKPCSKGGSGGQTKQYYVELELHTLLSTKHLASSDQ
jgi:hypothetical protein